MSFIAMNRFKVRLGSEADFETTWRERQGRLRELQGFQEFRMLKGPEGDGYRLYSSHVIWDRREDFEAWTKSEQFRHAHKNAENNKTQSPLMGPPQFEGFETILHEK
ncbi:antibiotic biosynthesis monooxygenase [Rhodobacteraceae bacterium B1Z28]|uniref:Antibiotic biosynthesis monooxygenase n=1 Tax=Ruegeria haliotis TaxID=2747601 RepID=A0ABX2PSF9_9RHOB|nr:antibiotic biosynthesis monooxygenase [Ruegeria haliotis]NVO57118.1 antibiotic biosynthesis monooxygenase [Ruegeria haliotis]